MSNDEAEREAQKRSRPDTGCLHAKAGYCREIATRTLPRPVFPWKVASKLTAISPIFPRRYQYDGETYHCYLSGSNEEGDYLFGQKPIDESIKERAETLDKQVEKSGWFSRKTLFLLGVLPLFWLGGVFGIFTGYDVYAYPFETGDMINMIMWGTLSWACYIGAAFCLARFVLMQVTYSRVKKEKERFESDHTLLRKQVLELVSNDAVSYEEKEKTIEGWLAGHSGGLASGKAQTESVIAAQKKRIRLVNILAIALVAIALVANVALNVAAASEATAEQAAEQAAQEQRRNERYGTYEDDYVDEQDAGYEWDMA